MKLSRTEVIGLVIALMSIGAVICGATIKLLGD